SRARSEPTLRSTPWSKRSLSASRRRGPGGSFTTATVGFRICRSATRSGWRRQGSSPRSAAREIATTTPWPRRPSGCSRRRRSPARGPGGALRTSSSPHSTGCGGSITTGYSSPSAGCHRPSTRRPIGAQETRGPCWRLSNNQVSDKPGAVHPSYVGGGAAVAAVMQTLSTKHGGVMETREQGAVVRHADSVAMKEIPVGRGASLQVLVGPDEGAPNFVLRRFRMEAGGGIPLHTNEVEHEQYVLRGRARVTIAGEAHEVGPDDTLYIPARVPHSYEVLEGPFEFICVVPNKPDQMRVLEPGDVG